MLQQRRTAAGPAATAATAAAAAAAAGAAPPARRKSAASPCMPPPALRPPRGLSLLLRSGSHPASHAQAGHVCSSGGCAGAQPTPQAQAAAAHQPQRHVLAQRQRRDGNPAVLHRPAVAALARVPAQQAGAQPQALQSLCCCLGSLCCEAAAWQAMRGRQCAHWAATSHNARAHSRM